MSEEKNIKMMQPFYAAKKSANEHLERDKCLGSFEYVCAAEFMSKFAKYMDLDVEGDKNPSGII